MKALTNSHSKWSSRTGEKESAPAENKGNKRQYFSLHDKRNDYTYKHSTTASLQALPSPARSFLRRQSIFFHRFRYHSATLLCDRSAPRHLQQVVRRLTSWTRASLLDLLLRYPILRRYSLRLLCAPRSHEQLADARVSLGIFRQLWAPAYGIQQSRPAI